MNEILKEIEFLKNLSSELTSLTIKLGKVNLLVTERASAAVEEFNKQEKEIMEVEGEI
jgi:hypothetical protein